MWVEFFGRFVGGGGVIFLFTMILRHTHFWQLLIFISLHKIYEYWKNIFLTTEKSYTLCEYKERTSTCTLNVHLIILGNKSLSGDENVKILKAVHTFIQNCGRFN